MACPEIENTVLRTPVDLSFSRAVWLAPVAYAGHYVEEYFGFPGWVTENFPTTFSQAEFYRNGVIFTVALVGLCLLVSGFLSKITVFGFLTYASGLFLHNGLFHVGATVALQTYSPGLITSLLLYTPLSLLLVNLALKTGLVTRSRLLAAFVFGGIAHYAFIIGQLT